MPAAEAKKADDASDDTRRNPRPPLRTGKLACSYYYKNVNLNEQAYKFKNCLYECAYDLVELV